MPARVEWPGQAKLVQQLKAMQNVDCLPLMKQWGDILVEGNRRGVLSGLDGHDRPMPPLKYRGGAGKKTANRRVPHYGTNRFETTGHGPYATGLHDNLTTAQYQQLTGLRLAPRGEASRVIKNLHAEGRQAGPKRWEAIAAWAGVVSLPTKKHPGGFPFLMAHFEPIKGHNPKYDLRPVRPRDYAFCLNALKAFARQVFFGRI